MSASGASAHGAHEDGAREDGTHEDGVHTIAFLGGTGPLGRGLALRLAAAGHRCLLGSRSVERAEEAAAGLRAKGAGGPRGSVDGAANLDAAEQADVVVVSVPYDALRPTLTEVAPAAAGTIVISCVNALSFDAQGPTAARVPAGSAAQECAALVPDARVVGAFHHVSAPLLLQPGRSLDSDVLITGDDDDANTVVAALVDQIGGARPVIVGPLRLAQPVEDMTAALISINKRYKAHAGVAITDLPA